MSLFSIPVAGVLHAITDDSAAVSVIQYNPIAPAAEGSETLPRKLLRLL